MEWTAPWAAGATATATARATTAAGAATAPAAVAARTARGVGTVLALLVALAGAATTVDAAPRSTPQPVPAGDADASADRDGPTPPAAGELRPLVRGPLLAPRGGVLGIPVAAASRPADAAASGSPPEASRFAGGPRDAFGLAGLPDAAVVRLADGRELDGLVAVLAPPTVTDLRDLRRTAWPAAWTRGRTRLSVLAPSVARGLGRPGPAVLLVRTPADAGGAIEVAGRRIPVTWADPAAAYAGVALPGADRPRLALEARPDRPDPEDPLDWWRWVLLADELDRRPPPLPPGDERSRRVAEQRADHWRLALGRLGARHPGVASTLRDALTLTLPAEDAIVTAGGILPLGPSGPARPAAGRDAGPATRPAPEAGSSRGGAAAAAGAATPGPAAPLPPAIAAWRTASPEVDRILAGLLDPDRPVSRIAAEIVAWSDATPAVLAWRASGDDPSPERVRLMVANRSIEPRRLRLAWEGRGPSAAREAMIPGRQALRLELPRPPRTASAEPGRRAIGLGPDRREGAADDGRPDVLLLTTPGARTTRLAWPPPVVPVRPPGIDLRPVPRLTLAVIEEGTLRDPAAVADVTATARVRRRAGRWEVFIECERPPGTEGDVVELLLGPAGDARVLRIPEDGPVTWRRPAAVAAEAGRRDAPRGTDAAAGPDAAGPTPRVDRRSWRDRWYARVTLPPRWVRGGTLDLGLRRGIDGDPIAGTATAPGPAEPWAHDPGRVRLDLRGWDGT